MATAIFFHDQPRTSGTAGGVANRSARTDGTHRETSEKRQFLDAGDGVVRLQPGAFDAAPRKLEEMETLSEKLFVRIDQLAGEIGRA